MLKRMVLLAGLVLAGVVNLGMSARAEVPRMPVEELQSRLGSADLVVLDVRSTRDWNASEEKIAGAVRENPARPQDWAGKYPKEATLVLYCT